MIHQLASDSGLVPRHDAFPVWLHEGLAAQFEVIRGGRWAGISRAHDLRLPDWRRLQSPLRSGAPGPQRRFRSRLQPRPVRPGLGPRLFPPHPAPAAVPDIHRLAAQSERGRGIACLGRWRPRFRRLSAGVRNRHGQAGKRVAPVHEDRPDTAGTARSRRGSSVKTEPSCRPRAELMELTEPARSLRSIEHAFTGRSSAWIERTVRDREVASSNLVAPI